MNGVSYVVHAEVLIRIAGARVERELYRSL
jgi:hypothetical protein